MTDEIQTSRENEGLTSRIPWKIALVAGIIAFVVVFGLVAVLIEVELMLEDDDIAVEDDEADVGEEPGFITERGWAFFSAHFVDVEGTAQTVFGDVDVTLDILDEWLESLPALLFYLVPILGLIAAGFAVVRREIASVQSEQDSVLFGASIVTGYLPLVLLGILLFTWEVDDGEAMLSYEVQFLEGLLLAGILFPLIFGAIGGYMAYRRQ